MSGSLPSNIRQFFSHMNGTGVVDNAATLPDTSETVCISPLSLLKMLKHGRAGIPMEVMGLMLGEFIDDFTISVVDVFSMPQSGNTVSVEAVDPAYQSLMLDMLKRTGRPEPVVGWYHSHPGFGCWFSGTDVNTQQSFEQLHNRAVGVVIDPVQSVKGKVMADCFRLIHPHTSLVGQEPRQTTSNVGLIQKASITALVHGLNRHYYSLVIRWSQGHRERRMLQTFARPEWSTTLRVKKASEVRQKRIDAVANLAEFSKAFIAAVERDLTTESQEALAVAKAGAIDAEGRLESESDELLSEVVLNMIGCHIATLAF